MSEAAPQVAQAFTNPNLNSQKNDNQPNDPGRDGVGRERETGIEREERKRETHTQTYSSGTEAPTPMHPRRLPGSRLCSPGE